MTTQIDTDPSRSTPVAIVPVVSEDASEGCSLSRHWFSIARMAVSMTLLCWLLRKVAWTEIVGTLAESIGRWPYLLLACLLPALGFVFAAFRWQLLLTAQGAWVSLQRLGQASLVGAFYNQLLPSTIGGDVARGWWVTASEEVTATGASRAPTLALHLTVVGVDRLVGLIGICAMAFVAASLNPAVVKQLPGGWLSFGIAVAGIGSLLGLLYLTVVVRRWALFAKQVPRLHRISEFIHRALTAYREEKPRVCMACGLSIGLQGLIILQYWALAQALGASLSIWSLAVVVPVVTLLSLVPLTVNGVGIRENALALLGAPFGLSPTAAVVLAYAVVLITLLYALLGGVIQLRGLRNSWSLKYESEANRGSHE